MQSAIIIAEANNAAAGIVAKHGGSLSAARKDALAEDIVTELLAARAHRRATYSEVPERLKDIVTSRRVNANQR